MADSKIIIRKSYVAECERFWKEAPVKYFHNNINNTKTLSSVTDAKSYIATISDIWEISDTKRGQMFVKTLQANCNHVGASATDHISAQYQEGGQEGSCKYILVAIYNNNGKITVFFSYHDITENMIGSKSVYSKYAGEITIDWLKSKAVDSLKGVLPNAASPQITYVQ